MESVENVNPLLKILTPFLFHRHESVINIFFGDHRRLGSIPNIYISRNRDIVDCPRCQSVLWIFFEFPMKTLHKIRSNFTEELTDEGCHTAALSNFPHGNVFFWQVLTSGFRNKYNYFSTKDTTIRTKMI